MPYRLILLLSIVTLLVGCRWIGLKSGYGYTVHDPEEESPDWIVLQVLKAANMEPFSKAWAEYTKYLHSEELNSPVAMKEWETLRFPALRRKHQCFLRDEQFGFQVMEEVFDTPTHMQIRVKCKTTDMPTPCHLFKDPANGDKWRVKWNCLN